MILPHQDLDERPVAVRHDVRRFGEKPEAEVAVQNMIGRVYWRLDDGDNG